jgi:AraC-like DNA-binding protein
LEDLQLDQIILAIAEALGALDRTSHREIDATCLRAVARARDFLDANIDRAVSSAELEAISGSGRFALARHFRACLGTSPYRYLVMRRLDRVRHLMLSGASLADVAASSGFADQSHMTRQFKRAYGVSPGHWRKIVAQCQ